MKRYVKKNIDPVEIKIDVEYCIEIFLDVENVAAATYKGFYVPEGELLPAERNEVMNSQAWADYCSFIDSVEGLLTDYYDLHIYYKNESEDYSFYWGLLAKNEDETLIIDFELKLRVSNHRPHRSKASQHNKKQQESELLKVTDGKKPRPITRKIVVNNEIFTSWMDAYLAVDDAIKSAVETMERRVK